MPLVNNMWGGMVWMWIFPVLFLAGLLLFLGIIARGLGSFRCGMRENDEKKGPSGETSKEILDRRYARGEITREQYLEMRKDLE
ncbi:MAG: SHOCT domain-containing protein [Leptospirales bacterium]